MSRRIGESATLSGCNTGSSRVMRSLTNQRTQLDPVIGSTMQLLRFVLNTERPDGAQDYSAIARADFSVVDQVLLLYVGLSEYGVASARSRLSATATCLRGAASIIVAREWIDQYHGAA